MREGRVGKRKERNLGKETMGGREWKRKRERGNRIDDRRVLKI